MAKLSIREVAKIMHKDPKYVREGLKQQVLPFGAAVKVSSRYSYYISPEKFYNYIGKRN